LNGDSFMVLLGALLYANLAWGRRRSHSFKFFLTMTLSKVLNIGFATSVWSSVCEWHAVLNFSLVPNFLHSVIQKWVRNFKSLSETMKRGMPWSLITSLNYNSATWEASFALWQAMKYAILENWSTTTKMESLLRWIRGRPSTKSMRTSSHGPWGVGKVV